MAQQNSKADVNANSTDERIAAAKDDYEALKTLCEGLRFDEEVAQAEVRSEVAAPQVLPPLLATNTTQAEVRSQAAAPRVVAPRLPLKPKARPYDPKGAAKGYASSSSASEGAATSASAGASSLVSAGAASSGSRSGGVNKLQRGIYYKWLARYRCGLTTKKEDDEVNKLYKPNKRQRAAGTGPFNQGEETAPFDFNDI